MFKLGDVVYCTINKCNGIVFSNECKAHTYNPLVVGFPDGSVSHYTIDGRPARTREVTLYSTIDDDGLPIDIGKLLFSKTF